MKQEILGPPASSQPLSFSRKVAIEYRDYVSSVRLFSRNARLYLIGSFLMGINFHVFQLLLNLYLKDSGFAEGQIGLVASGRAVGMTMIAIPAAILLSRIKLKPILIASTLLFGFFSYFIVSAEQLTMLIGFSVLAGMSFSFYRVAANPFYMRNSTQAERTHLFSFSFGMMILAGMLGSVGAGKSAMLISEYVGDIVVGYQYTLYAGIGLSMLSIIPFMMIKAAPPSSEENRILSSTKQFRRRWKVYLKIVSAGFLTGLGAGLTIPFLNLYFRDRFGLEADTIGLFYFGVQGAMLIGSLSGPVLAKHFGLVRTVVFTQLASIPFMLVLSYSYYLPLALAAFVIRGGLMNLGWPIFSNFGMEIVQDEERGLVNALLMVAWTSSWMFSVAVGGKMIELYGYTVTMNVTILLYMISTGLFYWFFRNAEKRIENQSGWSLMRENFT